MCPGTTVSVVVSLFEAAKAKLIEIILPSLKAPPPPVQSVYPSDMLMTLVNGIDCWDIECHASHVDTGVLYLVPLIVSIIKRVPSELIHMVLGFCDAIELWFATTDRDIEFFLRCCSKIRHAYYSFVHVITSLA